jgi:hypothetical protein
VALVADRYPPDANRCRCRATVGRVEIAVEMMLQVRDTRIDEVLDWPRQKADFERDGSLRDIYVQDATIEDWKAVITHILDGDYRARLVCGGAVVPMPGDFEALFGGKLYGNDRHFMSFSIGDVVLACHFFMPSEIEFSFGPEDVTETSLRDLLAFMLHLGEATRKIVVMTPENGPGCPIFRYASSEHQLSWIPPLDSPTELNN